MTTKRISLEQKLELLMKKGYKIELAYIESKGNYIALLEHKDKYVLANTGDDIKSAINKNYKSEFNK